MRTIALLLLALLSVKSSLFSQEGRNYPSTTVTALIEASRKTSFEYIVPVELSHVFKRYKNLPAIDSTSNKTMWYTPGMIRTVYFEDGNTAREQLLTVVEHESFSYRIDEFTSPLKHLARRIEGQWQFTETGAGNTLITWTYTIVPRHFLARWIIRGVVLRDITVLLDRGLDILKEDLEHDHLRPTSVHGAMQKGSSATR